MKKFLVLLIILAVSLVTIKVLPSSAEQIVNQEFLQSDEREAVESEIEAGMIFINKEFQENPEWKVSKEQLPATAGDPYKVHSIDSDKLKSINENSRFKNLMRSNYEWEFPILSSKGKVINVGTIAFFDGSWQFAGLGLTIPPNGVELSSNPDKIIKLLEQKNLAAEITEFKHLRWGLLHMDLLAVTANSQEYIIPIYKEKPKREGYISSSPLLDKIKPLQVYQTGDFINLIKEELSNTKPQMQY